MSKPRICKSCRWLRHRVEPCCSCSRWGKGKTDHYIPAEETLGEYLERKEREDMGVENMKNFSTDKLIKALRDNLGSKNSLKKIAADRLEQLQQELIDERDRYDRLVDFELAEAAELAEFKANTQNVVIVQFCKGSKKYLYALPKRSKVRKGMELTVNTGDICHACCDSFLVGGAALDALVELAGAKLPLAFVSGVVLDLAADE